MTFEFERIVFDEVNQDRSDDAWSGTIPQETDVLITHTPPKYHLDLPDGLGCKFLLNELWRSKPKLHIYGHVHAAHGSEWAFWDESQRIYEQICAKGNRGIIDDMLSLQMWFGIMRLLVHGALAVIWGRFWKGREGTCMINSSLMYRNTGQLKNAPHVIDI